MCKPLTWEHLPQYAVVVFSQFPVSPGHHGTDHGLHGLVSAESGSGQKVDVEVRDEEDSDGGIERPAVRDHHGGVGIDVRVRA